jgi:hypothetical protein
MSLSSMGAVQGCSAVVCAHTNCLSGVLFIGRMGIEQLDHLEDRSVSRLYEQDVLHLVPVPSSTRRREVKANN